jgi:acyl-CoA-binding protein
LQNRDRLELYALHKQAVSGDAPLSLVTSTAAEKAKYNAWRSKSTTAQLEAMRLYIQESDRQVRVYGLTPQTPETTPSIENGATASTTNNNTNSQQPRGLAAIPLLCAAASESRQAYLRRLSNTRLEQAWWSRQEPLCATPGSLLALPEFLVIRTAAVLERVSLASADGAAVIPAPVLQSFLWPLHNCLLAAWIALILVFTCMTAGLDLVQTLLWGSRRTGLSLAGVWKDQLFTTTHAVHSLTESHQPLSARLVGLVMLPVTVITAMTSHPPVLWGSLLYCAVMLMTWWYWCLVVPWLGLCLLGVAVGTGWCFALIEIAGV